MLATRGKIDIVQHRHGLPSEREECRSISSLYRSHKRGRGFLRIGRTNDIDLWHDPHRADCFDWFMRGSIFADTDGIVRENVDVRQLRKCGQPNRSTAIVREDQESCA